MEQRIQKILAEMGIASRRKAEEFIKEGRVTVNGVTATLGMKADPARDHVKVDHKLLTKIEPKVYFLFNKPRNVVTSLSDPRGRPTVKDYFKGIKYRVFPVGRLDFDSEGLLLVTNDGALAYSLLHPSKEVTKTYLVKVEGAVTEESLEKLRRGVRLEDGATAPAGVTIVRKLENSTWIEIAIHEGRKRQVRRMMERIGHAVIRLKRIGIDGLKLRDLKPGEIRPMTVSELEAVERAVRTKKERTGALE